MIPEDITTRLVQQKEQARRLNIIGNTINSLPYLPFAGFIMTPIIPALHDSTFYGPTTFFMTALGTLLCISHDILEESRRIRINYDTSLSAVTNNMQPSPERAP
ncbi:MAG TPA: hypothetical protein VJB87_01765 [Candidatus Nanoarchaeia archaeon]|nr:hypothetical protein [Candidatus Nanoarchaeia archaeon]